MFAIYQSGDLDAVERHLTGQERIDPNLCGEWKMEMDDVMRVNTAIVTEDDQGLYWHLFDGGSLLTLAIISRYAHRLEMIQLLLHLGARPTLRDLSWRDVLTDLDVCKLLIRANDVLPTELILDAFRIASLDVIRYLYECGNRLSRSQLHDVSVTIVQKRSGNTEELTDWAFRFAVRTYGMSCKT